MSGSLTAEERAEAERAPVLSEIRRGLSQPQKELPSKLFYDQRGSELFEEITRLPEYYLTRAEHALLEEWMPRWIAEIRPRSLVELGAGNAEKSRTILDAMHREGCGHFYVPVDISSEFLEQTAAALREEYPELTVVPCVGDFTRPLELPPELPRPTLITILGSTIGNFKAPDAIALLTRTRGSMQPGDLFLLGVDLRKDPALLQAAYDDSRGVTAEFNLNLLHVLNRDYGADFDLSAFQHVARYDPVAHRMEMHLESLHDQTVHLPGAGTFEIAGGETIRSEISCKYDEALVQELFIAAGLDLVRWTDDGWFALALGTPTGTQNSLNQAEQR